MFCSCHHDPTLLRRGPRVTFSEVCVDERYSTDIIKPRPLHDRKDCRALWEVFILRAKVEGQESVFPTLFLSCLPSFRPSIHPSILVLPSLFTVLQVLVMVALASSFSFVQHFDGLHQVALEGGQRGTDRGGSEAMCE